MSIFIKLSSDEQRLLQERAERLKVSSEEPATMAVRELLNWSR